MAAILLAGQPLAAQTTPAETEPPRSSTAWNAATARPPTPAASESALSLRVYDGLNSRSPLPYRPRQPDDPAYAVDVSAIMSRCADGRLVITALLIGGHLTPLDNRCGTGSAPDPGAPAPPCDATTWTCASRPEK
ncbi:MAG: hypothetical protein OEW88_08925 [Gammaproteobacteria bacterium]|nr:hypothetical protein [Gammaproteobacteria bacterium]MDH5276533.1 hypothetical protein [Gammaproteobacteria bacterium]